MSAVDWLSAAIEVEISRHRDEFFNARSCSCGWRAGRGPGGPQFRAHVADAVAYMVRSESAASRGLLW